MPWFKIDDGFHCHPKALAAGNAAVGLWTRLGAYCSDQLTDGFVPDAIARSYGTRTELQRLIDVRMIDRGDHDAYGTGYWLHDYLDFNPSADKVREERAAAAERQRRARERRELQQESHPDSPDESHRKSRSESRRTSGVSHAAPTRPDPTRPVSTSRSTDTPPARTVKRPVDNPTPIGELARRAIGNGGTMKNHQEFMRCLDDEDHQ